MSAWIAAHGHALSRAGRRLLATPLGTLFNALVISLALLLPAIAAIGVDNLRALSGNLSAAQEISIFLTDGLDRGGREAIETRLNNHANSLQVRFVAKAEALETMRRLEGMADAVAALPENPLPDAFIVRPRAVDAGAMTAMTNDFGGLAGVAHVQVDGDWVRKLDALLGIGRLASLLLAAVLGAALVAVVFNTVRLQVLSDRDEIEVARLVGATDAWIRRPFLYAGALQGALGGLFACVLTWAVFFWAAPTVSDFARLYGSDFTLSGPDPLQFGVLTAFAMMLGWLGAALSVRGQLRRLAP